MMNNLTFRKTTISDINDVHLFGLSIPELKVSRLTEFMSIDEVESMIINPEGSLFIALEKDQIIGFCYGTLDFQNQCQSERKACLVYIAVIESYRGKGIANHLYDIVTEDLKQMGAKYLYAWGNAQSHEITGFFIHKNMKMGSTCVWFDKRL